MEGGSVGFTNGIKKTHTQGASLPSRVQSQSSVALRMSMGMPLGQDGLNHQVVGGMLARNARREGISRRKRSAKSLPVSSTGLIKLYSVLYISYSEFRAPGTFFFTFNTQKVKKENVRTKPFFLQKISVLTELFFSSIHT